MRCREQNQKYVNASSRGGGEGGVISEANKDQPESSKPREPPPDTESP